MPFHPTGESQKITLTPSIAQTVEMAGLPTEKRVVRIVTMTVPSKGTMYVALGGEEVIVSNVTGMPLPVAVLGEQLLSVGDETHIAILVEGSGNYAVIVTPGELV